MKRLALAGVLALSLVASSSASAKTANPKGKLNGSCSYLLGNFTPTAAGFRFVSSATVHNTGNIGIVVQFETTWRRAGTSAIRMDKTVRVPRGHTKFVTMVRVVTQNDIDEIQAVAQAAQCGWKGTIIGTFGKAA